MSVSTGAISKTSNSEASTVLEYVWVRMLNIKRRLVHAGPEQQKLKPARNEQINGVTSTRRRNIPDIDRYPDTILPFSLINESHGSTPMNQDP